ncbi:Unknown protein [Striga hermonthica]|uniref:Uncharacterized protein n=1 Tax=Striga hermonthica TaxID=68872 RepID=A0A9N7MMX9_STRHE|nr:Unknown protein [Striga hermonthica]
MQSLLLFSSLPNSWETLVVTLSNSASNDKLSMSVFKDALFNEEARRKDMGINQTHALVMENRGRPQDKQQRSCRKKSMCRRKGRQSDDQRSHVCYLYGLEGHMKKNCYKWLEEQCKSNFQLKNSSQQKNKGKGGETFITVSGDVAYCSNHGKKLKCLISDNGGEYTSKEFNAYCRTYGIRHEKGGHFLEIKIAEVC